MTDAFYHSREDGILYYGVRLNNGENLNVGLTKACKLSTINYVTDEYD